MQLIRMTNCQAEWLKGFATSPRWNTMLLETGQWGPWSFQNATEAPVSTLLSSLEPKQNHNHPLEWHLALTSECEHNASTTKVPTFASFVASNINFWCPVATHIGSRTLNSQEKNILFGQICLPRAEVAPHFLAKLNVTWLGCTAITLLHLNVATGCSFKASDKCMPH